MTLSTSDFGAFHKAVHGGNHPFAWQQRLLEQIVRDKAWPRVLDLPTGVGKTTCIDIALFALALDVLNDSAVRWIGASWLIRSQSAGVPSCAH